MRFRFVSILFALVLVAGCTKKGEERLPFQGVELSSLSEIQRAAWKGRKGRLAELVKSGPVEEAAGISPLHLAADEEVARLLLVAGFSAQEEDRLRYTPLHFARDEKIARLLLEAGASIDARSFYGWTPLHAASAAGRKETAEFLLRKGAEVNSRTTNGMTPLHWAALMGKPHLVRLLLEHGADARAVDAHRLTPLHQAADGESVRLLLRAGADINARDDYLMTPLHLARNPEVATALIGAGADIGAGDCFQRTPLEMTGPRSEQNFVQGEMLLVPGDSALRLVADSGEILLSYRNATMLELSDVRLEPQGQVPLMLKIQPEKIDRCPPGERCVFLLSARRRPDTPAERFGLEVKFSAGNFPFFHKTTLPVDASENAARRERGWLPAGTVQVTNLSRPSRLLVLALACALPVALLLLWGLRLKKRPGKK
jgi:hypothetical protein